MSLEFIDNQNEKTHIEARVHFFDLVTEAEDLIVDARMYGKSASTKLLDTIDRLYELDKEILKWSHKSSESVPPKNYRHEVDLIANEYLPAVIHHESQKIKDAIHNLGCLNDGCKQLIDKLTSTVNYYGEIYPDLNLTKHLDEIETICMRVPRISNKTFWQKLFGN